MENLLRFRFCSWAYTRPHIYNQRTYIPDNLVLCCIFNAYNGTVKRMKWKSKEKNSNRDTHTTHQHSRYSSLFDACATLFGMEWNGKAHSVLEWRQRLLSKMGMWRLENLYACYRSRASMQYYSGMAYYMYCAGVSGRRTPAAHFGNWSQRVNEFFNRSTNHVIMRFENSYSWINHPKTDEKIIKYCPPLRIAMTKFLLIASSMV